ncbi:hypothetical protein SAMN05421811_117177 [Nonomuraea wenchangensis]|uniref:Uncharacterized protein n=1 Tax=Nonomuraea wenchangensis TaxID=568860 RepID=A0A1I0LJX4_9ACTN|nr:hypothetical protein SAMN05421811_117177 [Nonomuraea wenchangensis]
MPPPCIGGGTNTTRTIHPSSATSTSGLVHLRTVDTAPTNAGTACNSTTGTTRTTGHSTGSITRIACHSPRTTSSGITRAAESRPTRTASPRTADPGITRTASPGITRTASPGIPRTADSGTPRTASPGPASTTGFDRPGTPDATTRPALSALVIWRPEIPRPGLRPLPEPTVLHGPGRRRQIVIPALLDPHSRPRRRPHGRLRHLDHRRTGQRDPHRLLPSTTPTTSTVISRAPFTALATGIALAPLAKVTAIPLTLHTSVARIALVALLTWTIDRRRNQMRRTPLRRERSSHRSSIRDRSDARPASP